MSVFAPDGFCGYCGSSFPIRADGTMEYHGAGCRGSQRTPGETQLQGPFRLLPPVETPSMEKTRIVVPFTSLKTEVCAALRDVAPVVEWTYVGSRDEDYFVLLSELWAAARTFIIVEHDIVVSPGTISSLALCEGTWCASPYYYPHGLAAGLGCTKFSSALLKSAPRLMEEVGGMSDKSHPARHWCALDAWIQNVLKKRGLRPHLHQPVHHLDTTCSHGCLPTSATSHGFPEAAHLGAKERPAAVGPSRRRGRTSRDTSFASAPVPARGRRASQR